VAGCKFASSWRSPDLGSEVPSFPETPNEQAPLKSGISISVYIKSTFSLFCSLLPFSDVLKTCMEIRYMTRVISVIIVLNEDGSRFMSS
jgi:hypothetical protein